MVVSINYRKAPDTALQSVSFEDLAQQLGIIQLYAGCTLSGGYVLSNTKFYSDPYMDSSGMAIKADMTISSIDLDFDWLINKPMTIQGKAVVNVPVGINST